ncbi:branched-chain amino acid ABC transporter permease [Actinomadura rugatobispora]|uniref:Branched-chain amino acid ABC transporter permease n=1 Tax=Actinomadura rugatobispora TaxID=1994 RepID=A0ABW0ZZ49_9ACTN|nr:branched-chain amino acid ABC transporter permease [Actinomadura rugatobispora]
MDETLLMTGLIYYIVGLAFQVVLRSGVFSLAAAGFWGIGAYTTALTVQDLGWPVAVLLALLLAAVLALVLAVALGRLRGLYLGMATIAFDLLVVSLAFGWDSLTGGALGLYGIPRATTPWLIGAFAGLATLAVALVQSWAGGRFVDALRTDEPLARSLGIETGRLRVSMSVLSAVLGALAGALIPLTFGILGPGDSGFSLVVLGLTIVVIGGSGSWVGPAVGALVVTVLPELLRFVEEWRDVVYGALVILMALFAPSGLIGMAGRWRTRGRRPGNAPASTSEGVA